MVDFTRRKRFKTKKPRIRVDPGLKVGRYLLRLIVIDEQGNRSRAAQRHIEIVKNLTITTPRLTPVIRRGPVR